MKKNLLFFTSIIMLALTACQKEIESNTNKDELGATSQIALSFVPSTVSKAFGNGTTEVWEKTINKATIVVFNHTKEYGKIIYSRKLSATEIASMATTPLKFAIPGTDNGDQCRFMVVANEDVDLKSAQYGTFFKFNECRDIESYNGSFEDVTTKCLRTDGFVMSGDYVTTIEDAVNDVFIELKRVVAKLEIKCTTTPAFVTKYGPGTITVDEIDISNAANASDICYNDVSDLEMQRDYAPAQNSVNGQNIFYLFSQSTFSDVNVDNSLHLQIFATYDMDGSTTTKEDKIPIIYEVKFQGADNFIKFNAAYLLNVKIDGLTGYDVNMTVTVADWDIFTSEIIVG